MYACSSEYEQQEYGDESLPVEPLTVSGAMGLYNDAIGVLSKEKSSTGDSTDGITYKPSGYLAELFSDDQWYAVESPLEFQEGGITIMTPDVSSYVICMENLQ